MKYKYFKDEVNNLVYAYDENQMSFVDKINAPDFDGKDEIPAVYFEIDEKIKSMKPMSDKEYWEYINPPMTKEQLIAEAEVKKQMLISDANQKTQMWQTQLMLGIIAEEDKASLKEWMLYVQEVQTVDTSTAPDIDWPVKPA
ncbi:tail fiber assembly protein [Morganella morganii]|nr:tail fiber assembly protein [Morganella morganii]